MAYTAYEELKGTLRAIAATGATCYDCTNLDCAESTRHSIECRGLPCENYLGDACEAQAIRARIHASLCGRS